MAFELDLLGGFRLAADGNVVSVSARKTKALLCRVAVEPDNACSREQLAALLWPDKEPSAGRQNLRQALRDLRRACSTAHWLESTKNEIRIDPDVIAIDATRLRRARGLDDAEALGKALARYRGRLLDGMSLGVPAFDDWLESTRYELQNLAIEVCDRLIDLASTDQESLALYQRLLQLDPTLERAHRAIMEIHIAAGNETAALRQYARLRHTLNRELGVEPDAGITSLYEDLLSYRGRVVEARAIPQSPVRGDELRPATVLAIRLHSQRGDPEAAAHLREHAAAELASIARRFGGLLSVPVDRIAMITFGLDVVHGTEVDRARLAGEALMQEVGGTACGISIGAVLSRPNDGGVIGDPVDAARELAERAGGGEVWLSRAALAGMRIGLACEDVDARACRLVPSATLPAAQSPIVGRELETRHFLAIKDSVAEFREPGTLLIRGEPGIGKTRLLQAFRELAEADGFFVAQAETVDYSVGPGNEAGGQLVRAILGVDRGEDITRDALREALPRTLVPSALALTGAALSNDERQAIAGLPAQRRAARAAKALAALLEPGLTSGPALLLIEDIHWAATETLDLLASLAPALLHLPVLIVLSTRSVGEPLDHGWRSALAGTGLFTIDLKPLKYEDAATLARRKGVDDHRVIRKLFARTGGNPLFLEQLAVGDPDAAEIPPNVQGVIVSRLDQLPEGPRQTLRAASVAGNQFSTAELEALLEDEPELDELLRHNLIQPSDADWRFQHALIRDCCYQHMLGSHRRLLHARAAEHVRDSDPVRRAEHLFFAGDESAAPALLDAARTLRARLRFDDALRLLRLVAENSGEHRFAALIERGQIELQTGAASASRDTFGQALALADQQVAKAVCLLGRGRALAAMDVLDGALEDLEAAVEVSADDPRLQADAQLQFGNALFALGRLDGCLEAHTASLHSARQADDAVRIANAEGGLGDAYYSRGRMHRAKEHYARCVEQAEAAGFSAAVPSNLAMLGLTCMFVENGRTAVAHVERALSLSDESGDLRHEIMAHNQLGIIQMFYGDIDAGLGHASSAVGLAAEFGSLRFQVDSLTQSSHLHWCRGDLGAARAALGHALELLDEPSLLAFGGPFAFGMQALLAERDADRQSAMNRGIRILDAGALSHGHLLFYVTALQACLDAGDVSGVRSLAARLQAYTSGDPLPWADFFLQRARLLSGIASRGESAERLKETADRLGLHSKAAAIPG